MEWCSDDIWCCWNVTQGKGLREGNNKASVPPSAHPSRSFGWLFYFFRNKSASGILQKCHAAKTSRRMIDVIKTGNKSGPGYWSVSAAGCCWTGNAGLTLQQLDTVMWHWTGKSRKSPVHAGKASEPGLCNQTRVHAYWICADSPSNFWLFLQSLLHLIFRFSSSSFITPSKAGRRWSHSTPPGQTELFWPAKINTIDKTLRQTADGWSFLILQHVAVDWTVMQHVDVLPSCGINILNTYIVLAVNNPAYWGVVGFDS